MSIVCITKASPNDTLHKLDVMVLQGCKWREIALSSLSFNFCPQFLFCFVFLFFIIFFCTCTLVLSVFASIFLIAMTHITKWICNSICHLERYMYAWETSSILCFFFFHQNNEMVSLSALSGDFRSSRPSLHYIPFLPLVRNVTSALMTHLQCAVSDLCKCSNVNHYALQLPIPFVLVLGWVYCQ